VTNVRKHLFYKLPVQTAIILFGTITQLTALNAKNLQVVGVAKFASIVYATNALNISTIKANAQMAIERSLNRNKPNALNAIKFVIQDGAAMCVPIIFATSVKSKSNTDGKILLDFTLQILFDF
jgi:hypothetical protein